MKVSRNINLKRQLRNIVALLAVFTLAIIASAWSNMGQSPSADDQAKYARSPQWNDGRFKNELPQAPFDYPKILGMAFSGSSEARPKEPLPVKKIEPPYFEEFPASGLRVTWMGHSTLLLEIDGQRILVDPVWCERASPFSWAGVKRFHQTPIALENLPPIDAVVISHDHYDHLDMETVKKLSSQDISWFVPLGVGSHLRYWGVDESRIEEFDWWDEGRVGSVAVTAVPARHDSGRSILFTDRKATLWSGWAFNGPEHSVFFSGDTGMHDGFAEVGEKLGPFDLTFIEVGAYDPLWTDNHLGPEQAILAHKLVKGKLFVPVHWATFELAPHAWTEPVERLLIAAEKADVEISIPKPGESVELEQWPEKKQWWPELSWETLEEKVLWSSSVGHLISEYPNVPSRKPSTENSSEL